MSSERWNFTSYDQNLDIPLCGEVILLRYPIGIIDFKYGPTATLSSANTSHLYTNVSATSNSTGSSKCLKATLHYVLVVAVTHDKQNKSITITFYPIMSYSTAPSGFTGVWDADKWMCQRATDVECLNHLPIPAIGWTPRASPSPVAPALTFGGWLNSRCSWLAMVVVKHEFPETLKWCRHPNGPVLLDGGNSAILNLVLFLNTEISRITRELDTPPTNANRFAGLGGGYSFDAMLADEYYEPLTVEDIDRAMMGIDGVDPSTFWNFPGAPKQLREIAQQRQRDAIENEILKWDGNCYVEEDSCYAREDDKHESMAFLNVQDVLFGEEACGEACGED